MRRSCNEIPLVATQTSNVQFSPPGARILVCDGLDLVPDETSKALSRWGTRPRAGTVRTVRVIQMTSFMSNLTTYMFDRPYNIIMQTKKVIFLKFSRPFLATPFT
jgi:hypothetical protein